MTEQAALAAVVALGHLDWNFDKPEDLPAETKKRVPEIISKFRRAAPLPAITIQVHGNGKQR
jgi:hypothetical protein